MIFLAGIGYTLAKKNMVNVEGARQFSNLLLNACTPAIIIAPFNIAYSTPLLVNIGLMFGLSLAGIAVGVILVNLFLKKYSGQEKFAAIFSNSGFIGVPIVRALMGENALIYLSVFVVCFNLVSWTYGLTLLNGKPTSRSFRSFISNPVIVSSIIALCLFLSPFTLSGALGQTLNMVRDANTFLAMLVLGIHVTKADWRSVLIKPSSSIILFFRLLLIPGIVMVLLKFVPQQIVIMKEVVLIAVSAPIAMTLSLFSQVHHKDFYYSSALVGLSTLMSVITIPIMLLIAQSIW